MYTATIDVFRDGRALFFPTYLSTTTSLRDMVDDYGILPNPKYDEKQENYRKECKKYGVSLGCLEFDPNAQDEVKTSLSELVKHYWLFPLVEEPGKIWYLVTDHSYVLKELRFRSPLLQAKNAAFTEYDQFDNLKYEISFLMKRTQVPNFV